MVIIDCPLLWLVNIVDAVLWLDNITNAVLWLVGLWWCVKCNYQSQLPVKCINLIMLEVTAYQSQTFFFSSFNPRPWWSLKRRLSDVSCTNLDNLLQVILLNVTVWWSHSSTSQHRENSRTKYWNRLTTGWRLQIRVSRKYSASSVSPVYHVIIIFTVTTWLLQWELEMIIIIMSEYY